MKMAYFISFTTLTHLISRIYILLYIFVKMWCLFFQYISRFLRNLFNHEMIPGKLSIHRIYKSVLDQFCLGNQKKKCCKVITSYKLKIFRHHFEEYLYSFENISFRDSYFKTIGKVNISQRSATFAFSETPKRQQVQFFSKFLTTPIFYIYVTT